MKWLAALLGASLCLAGCAVGPKYQRPPVQSPPAWKTEGPWREAAPKDAIPKGAWWEIFHDEELNGYEQQLLQANQSLAAAGIAWIRLVRWRESHPPDCSHAQRRSQRIAQPVLRQSSREYDS